MEKARAVCMTPFVITVVLPNFFFSPLHGATFGMKRTFVVAVAILLLGLALVHAEDGKPEEKKTPPAASPSPANTPPSQPAEKPPPPKADKPPPSKPAAKPPASKPKSLGLRLTPAPIAPNLLSPPLQIGSPKVLQNKFS
jgi:hypothetical protein